MFQTIYSPNWLNVSNDHHYNMSPSSQTFLFSIYSFLVHPQNLSSSTFVGYFLVLTTLPSTIVTGNTSIPSRFSISFITMLSTKACGLLLRLYLSTFTPFFSRLLTTVDILKSSKSITGPHNPWNNTLNGQKWLFMPSNISPLIFILFTLVFSQLDFNSAYQNHFVICWNN